MEKTLKVKHKKKWFDMEFHPDPEQRKDEEYRSITDYWIKRLCEDFSYEFDEDTPLTFDATFKKFDVYHPFNGGHFGANIPNGKRKFLGIHIGEGKPEWGAEPGVKYFVISLGEIIK